MADVPLPTLLMIMSLAGVLAGAPLVWLGLRGRVIGDHPHCRRCGFDLSALPRDADRCAECGKYVRRRLNRWHRRDVRIGLRERRVVPLTWGVALAAPAALWLVMLAVTAIGSDDLYARVPEWMVDLEARAGWGVGARAVDELARRTRAGVLSPAREQALVARFLDDQADLDQSWLPEKGDFIGHVELSGRLKLADWDRYVAQAVAAGLTVRQTARADGPLPFSVRPEQLRFGAVNGPAFGSRNGPGSTGAVLRVIAEDANGVVHSIGQQPVRDLRSYVGSRQLTHSTIDGAVGFSGPFPPNTRRVGVVAEEAGGTTATAWWSASAPSSATVPLSPPPPPPRWPAGAQRFAVAPPGQPASVARDDPGMRDAIKRSLRLTVRTSFSVSGRVLGVHLDLGRDADTPWPLAASWRVVLVARPADGTGSPAEYPVGVVGFAAGRGADERGQTLSPTNTRRLTANDRLSVVLRPDPEFAESTVDAGTYWNGEVEFADVVLEERTSTHEPK